MVQLLKLFTTSVDDAEMTRTSSASTSSSSDDSLADALEAELFATDEGTSKEDVALKDAVADDDDDDKKGADDANGEDDDDGDAPERRRRVVRRRLNPPGRSRVDEEGKEGMRGAGGSTNATATTTTTCAHPAFMFDICVVCGKRKEDVGGERVTGDDAGASGGGERGGGRDAPGGVRGHFTTSMKYIHEGLTLSNEELEKAKREERAKVLERGKLTLILDLDHTLLNSAQFKELSQEQHDMLHECIAHEQTALPSGKRPLLYCLRHMGFFTKLRPHVFEFLEAVSRICQPYVYTMGDKAYAKEMVKLIDPDGKIFHGRVISNNDSTSSHVKDLDIVLGGETSAIIVDDTERVWPSNQGNLIRLDRYHFFPSSASSFQQKGQSVMDRSMVDEGEPGGPGRAVLLDVLAVIESAHRSFFKHVGETEPDVRDLLVSPTRLDLPLSGVTFVMSGITALGDRNPARHPLRLLASTLGATFAQSIEAGGDSITHVIAKSAGTEKVKWAKKTNGRVKVVSPDWLVACAQANIHADEERFALET